uniref:ubiquitinyl hydrolase 1 n=1 Tax=Romanomermis culicivorax TaxID=13658 RepID=A0A915IEB7_ROMCU
MFSSDGEYVTYSEIFQCLKALENSDALQPVCRALNDAKEDRIDFEKFLQWAVTNHKSFAIIGWFLDNPIKLNCDNYCPTFYQTLCGVTHLDENDIGCIEKQYSRLVDYRIGKLTLNQFRTYLNGCIPDELAKGLFQAFDENGDGEIDFKEIVCGISACCRGPKVELIFKMFDDRKSGCLTKENIFEMINKIVVDQEIYLSSEKYLYMMKPRLLIWESAPSQINHTETLLQITDWIGSFNHTKSGYVPVETVHAAALHAMRVGEEKKPNTDSSILSLSDFCVWAIQSELFDGLLFLLYQICHIIFGLPPKFKSDEKSITLSWRSRALRLGFKSGQIWYLVAKYWWQAWSDWMDYETTNNVCSLNTCQSSCSQIKITHTPSLTSSLISNDEITLSQETNCRSANPNSTFSFLRNNGNSIGGEVGCAVNSGYSSESGWESESSLYSKKTGIYKKRASAATYDVALASNANNLSELLSISSTSSVMPKMTSTPSSVSPFRSWSPCPKVTPQSEIIVEYKPPCKPGPIDNSSLVSTESISSKLVSLTLEGGTLKSEISTEDGIDFYVFPDTLWKAMARWYRGGSPVLPRTAKNRRPNFKNQLLFNSLTDQYELELYPIVVTFLKHQQINASTYSMNRFNYGTHMSHFGGGALFVPGTRIHVESFQKVDSGAHFLLQRNFRILQCFHQENFGNSNYSPQVRLPTVVRVPMYSAAFSRNNKLTEIFKFLCQQLNLNAEATRLWSLSQDEDVNLAKATLLDDDASTLSELQILTGTKILIEVRNADLTWPEEIISLSKDRQFSSRESCERGLTGLNNLGNTCFLNSALQCISNTQPLTQYFTRNVHLYELNKENKFGMKGQIALQYANLVRDLWSGNTKVTAPLKLRYTVCKYAPTFNDFNQHDCQELISFLLDGLHEDLNRVQVKSYVELKDSNGRPDEIVAAEAWDNHIRRNQSVIVDLFHGLLKSTVTCRVCGTPSVTFDPFTFLSLPLPLDNLAFVQVVVVKLDGSIPVKYGLRILNDATVAYLRKSLSSLCKLEAHNFLLLHLLNYSIIQEVLKDDLRIKSCANVVIYAFETPTVNQNKEGLIDESERECDAENAQPFKEKPKLCMQRSFSSVANGSYMNTHEQMLNSHKRSMSYVQWENNSSAPSKDASSSPSNKNDCKFKGFTIGIQRRLLRPILPTFVYTFCGKIFATALEELDEFKT